VDDDEPESFFGCNSENALRRVELPLVLAQAIERFLEISDKVIGISSHNDDVIHISLNVAMELIFEAHLDGPLVGSADVFSPKDSLVAVGAIRGDECGFDLVFHLECYLVVP
jgi:hypothetical protein